MLSRHIAVLLISRYNAYAHIVLAHIILVVRSRRATIFLLYYMSVCVYNSRYRCRDVYACVCVVPVYTVTPFL